MKVQKKRFIDNVWNGIRYDMDDVLNQVKDYDNSINIDDSSKLPNAEMMTKWVDSGAADKFLKSMNWNWQNFKTTSIGPDNIPLYVYLIDAYLKYNQAGGSNKERKIAAKANPYEVFTQSGLSVASQGEDLEDADMVILKSLENNNFIFVTPLSWEACKFMDSFECGGQGAKWCIGYEKDNSYWENYTEEGSLFILAYSKNPNPNQNELKYMIQIELGYKAHIWNQEDDSSRYSPTLFGHSVKELFDIFNNDIFSHNTIYEKKVWITHIDIPEGTAIIDDMAFKGYTSLKSISIPNSVTRIGKDAFSHCKSLASISIPENVNEIGSNAFFNCYSLKSINIPNNVTKIGKWSFAGCESLEKVNIPNNVTEIGVGAFSNCYSLKSINIPNNVTKIGAEAFFECYSLKSINIPNNITEIGEMAFEECYQLEIHYNGTEEHWEEIGGLDGDYKRVVFEESANSFYESIFSRALNEEFEDDPYYLSF